MSSSGYVAVPRCSVLFDGTNYAEFVGFMRIHMRGLLLWGVLSGEVSCPPCPVAPVAPTPPVPPALAADASEADRAAAKDADDLAVEAYDQQVSDYSESLSLFIGMLCLFTLSGAMMMLVLLLSSLLVFYPSLLLSLWDWALLLRCGLICVSAISPLVMLSTYLWSVRSMIFSKETRLLMSSTHSALPSGFSLTL